MNLDRQVIDEQHKGRVNDRMESISEGSRVCHDIKLIIFRDDSFPDSTTLVGRRALSRTKRRVSLVVSPTPCLPNRPNPASFCACLTHGGCAPCLPNRDDCSADVLRLRLRAVLFVLCTRYDSYRPLAIHFWDARMIVLCLHSSCEIARTP